MNQSRRKFFQLCFAGIAGTAIAKAIPKKQDSGIWAIRSNRANLVISVKANTDHVVEVIKRNYKTVEDHKAKFSRIGE